MTDLIPFHVFGLASGGKHRPVHRLALLRTSLQRARAAYASNTKCRICRGGTVAPLAPRTRNSTLDISFIIAWRLDQGGILLAPGQNKTSSTGRAGHAGYGGYYVGSLGGGLRQCLAIRALLPCGQTNVRAQIDILRTSSYVTFPPARAIFGLPLVGPLVGPLATVEIRLST